MGLGVGKEVDVWIYVWNEEYSAIEYAQRKERRIEWRGGYVGVCLTFVFFVSQPLTGLG